MNARELAEWIEREPRIVLDRGRETILRALRLLAAAEANDGSTPETDDCVKRANLLLLQCDSKDEINEQHILNHHDSVVLARRLERERNGLAARVGELEPDAERYRWLRSNPPDYRGLVAVIDLKSNVDAWLYGEYLDAAIDAARSKP